MGEWLGRKKYSSVAMKLSNPLTVFNLLICSKAVSAEEPRSQWDSIQAGEFKATPRLYSFASDRLLNLSSENGFDWSEISAGSAINKLKARQIPKPLHSRRWVASLDPPEVTQATTSCAKNKHFIDPWAAEKDIKFIWRRLIDHQSMFTLMSAHARMLS